METEYKWSAACAADYEKFKLALEETGFKVRPAAVNITDIYFTDARGLLNKAKTALRLRAVNARKYEITIKSATKIKKGLAKREEETIPLKSKTRAGAAAEFKAFFAERWPKSGPPLRLFTIVNKRRASKIKNAALRAEVAFDDCKISVNGKKIKLREIELELKNGSAAKFNALAARLTKVSGLKYSKISKVATAVKNLC